MRARVPLLLAAFAWLTLRPRAITWGATPEDITRPLPGDSLIPDSPRSSTMVITIRAHAAEVWPWLVQMGYHRAGWYTYPWVDRYLWHIENPSASQIVPELQDLSVGDVVPDGEPGTAFYRVAVLDPPHALVLHSTSHVPQPLRGRMAVDWTWAYELRQVDTTTTRLVLRVRATFDPWWVRLIYDGMIVPSDFVMARSMLRGIARRVEGRPSRADLDEAARRDSARAG